MTDTILWYDYETFGADPSIDRPAQFAGIRTDEELNELDEPVQLFCKPSPDYLPHPQACLITGITPQHCLREGMPEVEFIHQINQIFSVPGTCSAGYNSIRFDDEVTRYTLYRNFFDPYSREWQNGNSRWDLLDALRCAYALRPDGIQWPKHEDGRVSFRLEDLTAANGIDTGKAHDAVVDVRATIAMARLLKNAQPKLYRYLYEHRQKHKLAALVDVENNKPMAHVSGMYGVERGCLAIIAPLCWHPVNKNSFIAFDLSVDPAPLFDLTAEQIQQRVFTRADDMPEGVERLPLKEVHINKSPVLAPASTLTPDQAERWSLSGDVLRQNLKLIKEGLQRDNMLITKLHQVFGDRAFPPRVDVDSQLYGGFWSNADKQQMQRIHQTPKESLAGLNPQFQDIRGDELFFRFRARNYPEFLTQDDQERWAQHCSNQLLGQHEGLNFQMFAAELQRAAQENMDNPTKMFVLEELQLYAESIYPASYDGF